MALAPLPDIAWLIAYAPSSIWHFGKDIGMIGSVLLHTLLLVCYIFFGNVHVSETLLLLYMSVIHIPCVFLRLESTLQMICMSLLVLLGAFGLSVVDPDKSLSHANLRIVMLHCCINWL
jgi:hypothetical protein